MKEYEHFAVSIYTASLLPHQQPETHPPHLSFAARIVKWPVLLRAHSFSSVYSSSVRETEEDPWPCSQRICFAEVGTGKMGRVLGDCAGLPPSWKLQGEPGLLSNVRTAPCRNRRLFVEYFLPLLSDLLGWRGVRQGQSPPGQIPFQQPQQDMPLLRTL